MPAKLTSTAARVKIQTKRPSAHDNPVRQRAPVDGQPGRHPLRYGLRGRGHDNVGGSPGIAWLRKCLTIRSNHMLGLDPIGMKKKQASRQPRKPTGKAGPFVAHTKNTGAIEGEFQRIGFPKVKAEIEA